MEHSTAGGTTFPGATITAAATTATTATTAGDDFCRPVYEKDAATPLGQRLVMTPWMLLDGLKECQEDLVGLLEAVEETGLGLERRHGLLVNPLADRLEKVHFGVSHLLKLLWRAGLWTDGAVEEVTAVDGTVYHVLREPFTDGKANGRPLAADAPAWQRELLGLPVAAPPPVGTAAPGTPDAPALADGRDEEHELLLAVPGKL